MDLPDYAGILVRITDERRAHILEHPEMTALIEAIAETLAAPETVIQSASDPETRLYYRATTTASFGEKYLCVVVKVRQHDAFVLTAYLTDQVKKGTLIWSKS